MFETYDLNLASFLRCRDFKIMQIFSSNGRTAFVFEESSSLRTAILDFANDGVVPARSFCNTLRDLKGLTHSAHQEAGKRIAGMDAS